MLGENVERLEPCAQEGNAKMVQPLWSAAVLQKLNIEPAYDPIIPLLSMYSKDVKAGTERDISIPYSWQLCLQ